MIIVSSTIMTVISVLDTEIYKKGGENGYLHS